MKYVKILKRLIRHPVILKEICLYLKNDTLALLGVYKYDYSILFVDGLIKSGSSWLGNMLALVPGYNLRSINDPSNSVYNHDISDSIFSSLPKNRYSVMKLHTRYTKENFRVIKKYVQKFVIIYRDLRDVCTGRYFAVKVDPKNKLHTLYNSISREEGIAHSIETVEKHHAPWIRDWMNAASLNKDMILTLKYEDLNLDTAKTLKQVFEFFRIKPDEKLINSLAATKITKEVDLSEALKKDLPGRLRSSARKGIIGDWKNYFTEEHKKKFKAIAGDLLIKLGYEKDDKW